MKRLVEHRKVIFQGAIQIESPMTELHLWKRFVMQLQEFGGLDVLVANQL